MKRDYDSVSTFMLSHAQFHVASFLVYEGETGFLQRSDGVSSRYYREPRHYTATSTVVTSGDKAVRFRLVMSSSLR